MKIRMIAVLLLVPTVAPAETFSGRVVGVADGDTITIPHTKGDRKQPRKIRIMGIDAPEAKQTTGNRAKQAMSDPAYGEQADADCPRVDRYGRDACKVRVDGVDVGIELIQQG